MVKQKTKTKKKKKEDGWDWIRIKKPTTDKLKILKGKFRLITYDDVLNHLMAKENLEFKEI